MPRAVRLDAASPYPPGWEPFLAAINADLDDDTPRLVFADWLQENGDEPRAAFIRLQCAGDAVAADALLTEHRERWLRGLPKGCREHPDRVGFRRGFVAALEVRGRDWASTSAYAKDWDANGKAIRRITALEELCIEQVWNTVAKSAALKGLRALTLPSAGSGLIESLAESPVLPSLTALTIIAKSSNGVSQRSFRRLFANPQLASLRCLRVASMRLGNLVAECLNASHFAALEELRLLHLSVDPTGVRALAHSPALANLRVLHLLNNQIGDTGLRDLLAAPGLRNVEELVLESCRLSPASALVLANWEGLRSVRSLNLLDNALATSDAEIITQSIHARNLTDLRVGRQARP